MTCLAKDAGWHKSKYNIGAQIPGTDQFVIANLFKGTCGVYSPAELFLLDELETLEEDHPILQRFAERGLIANFDEQAAMECNSRVECGLSKAVELTICPTTGCNFDCPYCYEKHNSGIMTQQVQDDVMGLVERFFRIASPTELYITWFGGEPLLAPEVIESLSERLIAMAEERNIWYSAQIITNGYLLTQPIVDMLGRVRVHKAQITMDGIGETHDKTRHLAGGGPTFERITENLRTLKIPFQVSIRHNLYEENKDQVEPLRKLIRELSEESGNNIAYYYWYVINNDATEERGTRVPAMGMQTLCEATIEEYAARFPAGAGIACTANRLFNLGIDEKGNLQKCWEDVDKPEHSFGTAAKWDPAKPISTADHPDYLTCYINASQPFKDVECQNCIWLPNCAGGCPNKRLFNKKICPPYKNYPERYALELYQRLEKRKAAFSKRKQEEML